MQGPYIIACWWPFCHAIYTSTKCPRALGTLTRPWNEGGVVSMLGRRVKYHGKYATNIQQMWFCFYPSPISINISSYVYNALRLTPEIWFWAMPFASFQIDINKYFAIVSPRCQVISNCDVMPPWITWQNNRLIISRFAILSREYLLQTVLYNQ